MKGGSMSSGCSTLIARLSNSTLTRPTAAAAPRTSPTSTGSATRTESPSAPTTEIVRDTEPAHSSRKRISFESKGSGQGRSPYSRRCPATERRDKSRLSSRSNECRASSCCPRKSAWSPLCMTSRMQRIQSLPRLRTRVRPTADPPGRYAAMDEATDARSSHGAKLKRTRRSPAGGGNSRMLDIEGICAITLDTLRDPRRPTESARWPQGGS